MNHTCRRWQVSLINVVCVLTVPITSCSPPPPLHRPLYFLRTTILKLGQLIILQWPLSVQHASPSLTSNKKLEMIQRSEESTSKADLDQTAGLLYQTANLWMQKKSSRRQIKVLLHEHTNDKEANQLYSTVTIQHMWGQCGHFPINSGSNRRMPTIIDICST